MKQCSPLSSINPDLRTHADTMKLHDAYIWEQDRPFKWVPSCLTLRTHYPPRMHLIIYPQTHLSTTYLGIPYSKGSRSDQRSQ